MNRKEDKEVQRKRREEKREKEIGRDRDGERVVKSECV